MKIFERKLYDITNRQGEIEEHYGVWWGQGIQRKYHIDYNNKIVCRGL